jgi:hypothetical protein
MRHESNKCDARESSDREAPPDNLGRGGTIKECLTSMDLDSNLLKVTPIPHLCEVALEENTDLAEGVTSAPI